MGTYRGITLEMSLKPFRRTDDTYIEEVCRHVFTQWYPLVKDAEEISVMLWTADGSEILDYTGELDRAFPFASLLGRANGEGRVPKALDPNGTALHNRSYPYMDEPPVMTYRILQKIVATIKRIGRQILSGKTVLVGETFDPGPEFSKSDFKYKYHNEICGGKGMGKGTMIDAASTLHGDTRVYAGFPHGIPEGTSFGTFFGRQCRHFLPDMGFDYIWLSNGVGFGREMWSTDGAIFDGTHFDGENLERVTERVFAFWSDFRAECGIPIKTRGTNMSMGIDYASDGVPLQKIYANVPDLLPPPNSPWAALNFDYGLELMGHMSRIAEIPAERYLFRYYIHDPWWVNSPWYDRYEGQPNDIYLPMAISRIDERGRVCPASELHLLSIDNSFGELPDACANEPIPHLLRAAKEAPDAPGSIVWVYPFAEYNRARGSDELSAMFSEDWFVRNAINAGVPINTVVSTDSFSALDPSVFSGSILLSPVPEAGGAYEGAILSYLASGGRVIFYGSVTRSSDTFRTVLGLSLTDAVFGVLPLRVGGDECLPIKHDPLLSGGGIDTVLASARASLLAECGGRAYAVCTDSFGWLRATNSADYTGESLLSAHDRCVYTKGEELLLSMLARLGFHISFARESERSPAVVSTVHRHNGAFIWSFYAPDTTVGVGLRTPLGIPAFSGGETLIRDGLGHYRFPRFERRECRVFVEQETGIVTVKEWPPVSVEYRRRIRVTGLRSATVRLFAEEYCKESATVIVNGSPAYDAWAVGDVHEVRVVRDENGTYLELSGVTGELMLSMPCRR